ncbi:MAG: cytochrome b, partial [Actinomycetota bacterium]|nr:cytochrome b [Actinomycetota bacterium]
MIVRRLVDGVDERLDGTSFIRRNLGKVFPDHWSFMLGELALYSFVMLLLTGTFLSLFFVASPAETVYRGPYAPMQGSEVSLAYESVLRISFEVRAGLVMRQTHHWAALVFVASMTAHLVRVFFTGAFRKPRELSWIIGVTLLVAGIGGGFTGYSLPDDLLSGTGLRIIYSAVLSIPVVGTWLAYLFFGGEFPSAELIPRLFVMHILLIPALITGLLSAHLALVWHQTHTQFRPKGTPESSVTGTPVWPKFALKSVGLAFITFAVLAALGGLFQINPVWLYGP